MKKKEGSISEFCIGGMAIFIIAIVLVTIFKLKEIDITRNLVEDGLALSNLAAATIDIKEYGTSNKIINNDFNKSYNDFLTSLKYNLNLDDNYNPKKNKFIKSKVTVDDFKIYNVIGNDIEVNSRSSSGVKKDLIVNGYGTAKTPDGVLIKTTTIYSKISFDIKSLLNKETYRVAREKSVDVTDKD